MTKLKMMLMAALIAIGQIFALPASAQDRGTKILMGGTIGCAVGVILPPPGWDKASSCVVTAAGTIALGAIFDSIIGNFVPGINAVPDSRWSFDGGDGMPKAVYSFSDAAKLSLGAKGAPLDYDGIAVGLKYSF